MRAYLRHLVSARSLLLARIHFSEEVFYEMACKYLIISRLSQKVVTAAYKVSMPNSFNHGDVMHTLRRVDAYIVHLHIRRLVTSHWLL